MRQVTIAELRAYVVRTYEPDDAVYTRICHFMQLRQGNMGVEQYFRLRQQDTNRLAVDGIEIPEDVERALVMRSIHPGLRAELTKTVGWWRLSVRELRDRAIAESKAKGWLITGDGQKGASGGGGSHLSRSVSIKPHLLVAEGVPRDSTRQPSVRPIKNGAQKRRAETLATATALQKQRTQNGQRIILKDMKKLYSRDDWLRRCIYLGLGVRAQLLALHARLVAHCVWPSAADCWDGSRRGRWRGVLS